MIIAKDKWTSIETSIVNVPVLKYDKVQHFLAGIITSRIFLSTIYYALFFWILWEIKHGLISYKI